MSEIHDAFAIFRLQPGASKEKIQARYKALIKAWHPDRYESAEDKAYAEEELKTINNANDVFRRHFAGEHTASGCVCQRPIPGSSAKAQTGPQPKPKTDYESKPDPEAAARRRDEERRRKAAQESAESQKSQEQQSTKDEFAEAQRQQEELKSHKLRWQIAAGEAAAFVLIVIFASAGHGIKAWWHDVSWKWNQEHPAQSRPSQPAPTPSYTPAPYPNYQPQQSEGPELLPNGVVKPLDNSHVPVPHYPPRSQWTNPIAPQAIEQQSGNPHPSSPESTYLDSSRLRTLPLPPGDLNASGGATDRGATTR